MSVFEKKMGIIKSIVTILCFSLVMASAEVSTVTVINSILNPSQIVLKMHERIFPIIR